VFPISSRRFVRILFICFSKSFTASRRLLCPTTNADLGPVFTVAWSPHNANIGIPPKRQVPILNIKIPARCFEDADRLSFFAYNLEKGERGKKSLSKYFTLSLYKALPSSLPRDQTLSVPNIYIIHFPTIYFIYYLGNLFSLMPLWPSGQSSWLQIQRSWFDSRRYRFSEK
jgi:hypothetical protein